MPDAVDSVAAASGFSGVVRVDKSGALELARAYGFAHRGYSIANSVDTRFGIASGTKGLTALAIMRLVEGGGIELATTARSVLGTDLPLIDDRVTIEHLLAHRSGIGDYFDEDVVESVTDYVLPVPVHRLVTTADYLAVLAGHQQVFSPGSRFAYNNSGYVVLALIAERISGTPFARLVSETVCRPAGMQQTAFLRSDEPAQLVALGYLEQDGHRTNLLHLPVCGSGDGGIVSTAADIRALWQALFGGRIVSPDTLATMLAPRSEHYGLGFWLDTGSGAVSLEGSDAGISFRSVHVPATDTTRTVLSNTTNGAWEIADRLDSL